MSRLIHTPQGYDLTNNPPSLPWTFLHSKHLTRLTIEVSRLSPLELFSGLKNDVRLLLEYEPVDQYPAISLRMEYYTDSDDPDFDPNGFQEAYLCAKPCLAAGPGLTTFCTLELDINEGWTLAGVFNALLASNVQHFDFQMILFLCHGQRDFLTQAIHTLEEANVLKSPSFTCIAGTYPLVPNIYAALSVRYTSRGLMLCSIQKGRFTRGYERGFNPHMLYRLDQRTLTMREAIMLAHLQWTVYHTDSESDDEDNTEAMTNP